MGIVAWVFFGIIAGWLASLIVRDNKPRGCFTKMVIGIIGALLGGFIYQIATGRSWSFAFDFASLGVAVLGSILLLLVISLAARRR